MVISISHLWARARFLAEERGLAARQARRLIRQAFAQVAPLHQRWLEEVASPEPAPALLRQNAQAAWWAFLIWSEDPCWGPSCRQALLNERELMKVAQLPPYPIELGQRWAQFNQMVERYWSETLGQPWGPQPWHSPLLKSAPISLADLAA